MNHTNSALKERNLQCKQQLKEELKIVNSFMDDITDAIFLVDSNAHFLYVNSASYSMTGYSREELLSMTIHDMNSYFKPQVWLEYWKTITQQGYLTVKSLHQTKEGLSFPIKITLFSFEHERTQYCCIFVTDIDKYKKLEAALQEVNEALEIRLSECMTKLSHAHGQLNHNSFARKQLEELPKEIAAKQKKTKALNKFEITLSQQNQNLQISSSKESLDLNLSFPANSKLRKVFQFIEDNYHQSISVRDVAQAVGYSPAYLTDFVKRKTTKSIHYWIVERKMAEARSLLLETDDFVNQIATKVGYSDTGHFIRQFRQLYSIPPKKWRTKHSLKSRYMNELINFSKMKSVI